MLLELRTPRVAELLRKALEWQALLESGEAKNQADIARREGISLAMPEMIHRQAISERALRPIAQLKDVTEQQARFRECIGEVR